MTLDVKLTSHFFQEVDITLETKKTKKTNNQKQDIIIYNRALLGFVRKNSVTEKIGYQGGLWAGEHHGIELHVGWE